MSKTILFIHGAYVNSKCWDKFVSYFEKKGYECICPNWPYKDGKVNELKRNISPKLAKLTINEIINHYKGIIDKMDEKPILIGHSFGGLFVQKLLDDGYGKLGVAIDSAPPKGVFPITISVLISLSNVLKLWESLGKVITFPFKNFQYGFVNTLPINLQQEAYDNYVIPECGSIFLQSKPKINFKNSNRSPLLLIAGEKDNIVPEKIVRNNYLKYDKSISKVDFKSFTNKDHWIIADPGWQEVCLYIDEWINKYDN